MSQIIAGTYQIIRELGSGGGGIVYLATHLRLGKLVVLKADKRSLTRHPEVLRREVDALKNLSHTYIPQVYDFIEENGVVYTVIDYVEGESLDKPLKRGVRFSQPQVIKWACQLLEALQYLHTRPPYGILHGDIKPANVMLTPQGDIKLIDFNIALALGEEGAVRVGFSQGYASPEHYGIDYSGISRTQCTDDAVTVVTELPETQVSSGMTKPPTGRSASGGNRSKSGGPPVLLNVRSDIYSLGATLYHLLTGQRPPQDARQAAPIPADTASPAVAAIILKAMEPDQEKRYQSASEMLDAFRHLYENDPRTIRYQKAVRRMAALLCALFLAGGALVFCGLQRSEREKNAQVLAEYSMDAYRQGDAETALQYAMEAMPHGSGLLSAPCTPQAQRALAQALGVYQLNDGFSASALLDLPSEPLKLALSESGSCLAVLTSGEVRLYDTESGTLTAQLPAYPSSLSDIVFHQETLFYAGADGLCCYDVQNGRQLWQGEPATAIACSEDGSSVAGIFMADEQALVYDAAGTLRYRVSFSGQHQDAPYNDSFADPGNHLLALSEDGRWLAVSFSGGTLTLFDLESSQSRNIYTDTPYTHFEGGFCGSCFACAASGDNTSEFSVWDTRTGQSTGSFSATAPFHAVADSRGILVSSGNTLVQIDPESGVQTEAAYTASDITAFSRDTYTAVISADNTCGIFDKTAASVTTVSNDKALDFVCLRGGVAAAASRSTPCVRLLKLEHHPEAQVFTYDPGFAHDEARVSTDRSTVMLFRYDAFRLYRMDGTPLCEEAIPDAEHVYDQQYRRQEDGCVLEVTYYDGLVRQYDAADGRLVAETQGPQPDKSLLEEFETDHLRIVSPLHGTPEVYDRESGEKLGTLESQDYLTYVTQVGQYVIAEYITVGGTRYGMLLDETGGILADLPGLCDVLPDGTLMFDDQRGNLRQSRIYSAQELMALAIQ